VYARAQLAGLLREVGLVEEARKEGELALAALAEMPKPTMTDHASRNTFRALARASEGAGRDEDAFKWYSDFVEFGSGFRGCSGCHSLAGPTGTSFFRDWWAGKRYAELAWQTGKAPALITANERALAATPDSLLAQIRLAYLYDGHGETTRAAQIWSQVDRPGEARAALAP
jgi:hypothetical protein